MMGTDLIGSVLLFRHDSIRYGGYSCDTITAVCRKMHRRNGMAWYDEAVFYHIYPLGLTGSPRKNDYGEPVHRLNTLIPWIDHIKTLGFNALYIGPLFESEGHGYETTDYRKLDSRLGTNEDLKAFVKTCHEKGVKVIFDGVFNHTGRSFFAFRDIQENRENSRYRDWYCNVNFWGNTEYNDGFSYDNWGGYNLLVKLNQRNPEVKEYIADVIRFWVSEFDVDGIRLDAADVLDFEFMKMLRKTADSVKEDFWLMGEVIHGDYSRWVNADTLHSVTNYSLHKALYSGHNDHNYFEIAHTVRYIGNMFRGSVRLYNFVDNHDVERIYSKLTNKAHYVPVHILLYTLYGIPSVYYGSEFGVEGKKDRWSDDNLRPYIRLEDHQNDIRTNPCTRLIAALGKIRQECPDLTYGEYRELSLTNRQFAFARGAMIIAVNNDENGASVNVQAEGTYNGLLSGKSYTTEDGRVTISLPACGGDILIPSDSGIKGSVKTEEFSVKKAPSEGEKKPLKNMESKQEKSIDKQETDKKLPEKKEEVQTSDSLSKRVKKEETEKKAPVEIPDIPYEEMTVEQLQAVILAKMEANGPVSEQMKKDVTDNIWQNSLVNWAKSFH